MFNLMINDLDISGAPLWKYVNDLTVSEIVPENMNEQHADDAVHCGRHPISISILEIYSERR